MFALVCALVALCTCALAQDQPSDLRAAAPLWEATDGDIIGTPVPVAALAATATTTSSENGIFLVLALAGSVIVAILAFCVGVYTGTVIKRNTVMSREMMAQRIGPGQTTGIDVQTGETILIQSAASVLAPPQLRQQQPAVQHRQVSATSATLTQNAANNRLASFVVGKGKRNK